MLDHTDYVIISLTAGCFYKIITTNTFFILKKLFLSGSGILGLFVDTFNADDKYSRQSRYHMDC